jgi:acyl-CoA synthetase (AMP-forming)/AMP-acid ligase II
VSEIVQTFAAIARDEAGRAVILLPEQERTLTAADVWRAHDEHVRALTSLGLGQGDLVVCAIGNRPEFLPLLLASRRLDIVLMPVDPGTTRDETMRLCQRFGAAALLAPATDGHGHTGTATLGPGLVLTRCSAAQVSYPGIAVLKLTSGSTGPARAARTTESQLVADGRQIMSTMGIGRADTQLATIPLAHSYGLGVVVMPLLLQGTAVVLRESFVPQQIAGDAERYGVRCLPGAPYMFEHFIAHAEAGEWPSGVRLLISAGAGLALATQRAFHDRFNVKIHTFYGTTETGGITYDDRDTIDDGATVGRPLDGVTLSLRAEAGLPDGRGRVHVSSAAVADGYAGGDSADFDEHGFLTGDYGSLGSDGRLTLAGRVSAFINVAGRKVQPEEVEMVLRDCPAVLDARVLAAADRQRGQQVVAVVTPRPGQAPPTLMEIRQFCSTRLAAHKIPRRVLVIDAIPLTPRGKVDRAALAALVDTGLEG